jgi:hypothetical protein
VGTNGRALSRAEFALLWEEEEEEEEEGLFKSNAREEKGLFKANRVN